MKRKDPITTPSTFNQVKRFKKNYSGVVLSFQFSLLVATSLHLDLNPNTFDFGKKKDLF